MYGMNGVQKREKCVHFKNLVVHVRRYITMKFKITKSPGKLPFYTMSLFTLLLLSSSLVFGAFAQSRKAPLLFFVVFCFVFFQVPLTSCASPWRAGETRNVASQKNCHYYVTKLSVVSYVHPPAIIPA